MPTGVHEGKAKGKQAAEIGYAIRPFGVAERVRERSGLDARTMARYLGVSEKTYARRAESGKLEGGESLKVSMLERILEEATRVFRNEDEARHWINTPIISLDHKRPIEHLTSIEGYERVKNTLTKIEYGMY
jgi:putative toxin-antitoxin system antitoxin component (TIGR02293 family)